MPRGGASRPRRAKTRRRSPTTLPHPGPSAAATPRRGSRRSTSCRRLTPARGVSVAILGEGRDRLRSSRTSTSSDDVNKFPQVPVKVRPTRRRTATSATTSGQTPEWNIRHAGDPRHGAGIRGERSLYFRGRASPDHRPLGRLDGHLWSTDPSGPPIMNASLGEWRGSSRRSNPNAERTSRSTRSTATRKRKARCRCRRGCRTRPEPGASRSCCSRAVIEGPLRFFGVVR